MKRVPDTNICVYIGKRGHIEIEIEKLKPCIESRSSIEDEEEITSKKLTLKLHRTKDQYVAFTKREEEK